MMKEEYQFRALIENSHDGIAILGKDDKLAYVTPSARRILGYDPEELIGTDPVVFIHPEDLNDLAGALASVVECYGETVTATSRMLHKNKTWRTIRANITNLLHMEGIEGLVFNFQDVTTLVHTEEKLVYANRLYAFMTTINQIMLHATDEKEIFKQACRIAVEEGKFKMAWIGLFIADKAEVLLLDCCGIPEEDQHLFSNTYDSKGPQAYVRSRETYFVCNDIQKELGLQDWQIYASGRGINSGMVIPLKRQGTVIGTFNLYSGDIGFFDTGEIKLLLEAASDISFSLEVLDREKERQAIQDRLVYSESKLRQAQAIAHVGNWELTLSTGIAIWSEEACRIYGIPPEKNTLRYEDWLSFLHPDDKDRVLKIVNQAYEQYRNSAFYHRIVLRDGTVKYLYSVSQFEFDPAGYPVVLYGVAHDVTNQKVIEEKLINANRLYSFISNINQVIVHTQEEAQLFRDTCRIAIEIGNFSLAWIGIPDPAQHTIEIVAQSNAPADDAGEMTSFSYRNGDAMTALLREGSLYIVNDTGSEPVLAELNTFVQQNAYRSLISLPVMKGGQVYAVLTLFSSVTGLFDDEEIRLLKEVAKDISFAMEVFEKERLRQIAEENTEASELRMKQAQAIAHVGNWKVNFASGIARWSDEHCRIYGLPIEDDTHTFESWMSFIHPEDFDTVLSAIQGDGVADNDPAINHRIVRRDGSIRYIEMHSVFERDEEGQPVGLHGVSHDITKITEARESLVQSEANLRLILDLIPQSIFVRDCDGRYLFVNRSFAEQYGLSPQDFIRRSRKEAITDGEQALRDAEEDEAIIRSDQGMNILERPFTDARGATRLFNIMKLPYSPATTGKKAILSIAQDITEQKSAELERAKITLDIVNRNKDLEQFSYIVSHNLRTHVANIIGLTDIFNIASLDPKEEKEVVNEISKSVHSLDNVIKDLNYILQVKDNMPSQKETVVFSELLEELMANSSKSLSAGVRIINNFEVKEISTLKGYLYSIFYNLVSNSIKYRKPDQEALISISTFRKDDKICLVFKDNGLGIDLEQREAQVFGLYKRFHSHVEGRGLGLYMVKTQVESLNGKISVASKAGEGTEFTIEFTIN